MPWKEVGKVELRRIFIERVISGDMNMSYACQEFGVSRQCGYKWLRRWREGGEKALNDRSRRPLRMNIVTAPELVQAVISERISHPYWGARKIGKRLEMAGINPPAERTINRILKRHGMIKPRKSDSSPPQRFARQAPNSLWQMDHKGAIRGKWRSRSIPFVLLDDASRYLVGLWSLPDKSLSSTWPCLWQAFGDFGLPDSILSDNDIIFAGRNGPSWIESCLMRLGVDVIHGRPYHPQTQGKVERLNGTLKLEILQDGVFEKAEEFQANFDLFRHRYNFERPHEALGLEVPASRYSPSKRKRPDVLPELEYGSGAVLRKVDPYGRIRYRNYMVDVGRGICGQRVEVREGADCLEVFYGQYRILGFVPGEERVRRFRQYRQIPGRR